MFFENVQNLMYISKMQKRFAKENFFFLRSLRLDWLHEIVSIEKGILVIGSQYVK